MPAGAQFKVDTREFTETLRKYREYSKRDPAVICNTKAFYIARRATLETGKSTKPQIKKDLMKIGNRATRNGKAVAGNTAPIVALLINKLRKAENLPGLYGKAMRDAINEYIKNRKVATLRAGWIPAIKGLEPLAAVLGGRKPRMDTRAEVIGKPKGKFNPAKSGFWTTQAIIENLSGAKWDTKNTATAKAAPALQRAFDAEALSMQEYIERKLRDTADKAGIKHN